VIEQAGRCVCPPSLVLGIWGEFLSHVEIKGSLASVAYDAPHDGVSDHDRMIQPSSTTTGVDELVPSTLRIAIDYCATLYNIIVTPCTCSHLFHQRRTYLYVSAFCQRPMSATSRGEITGERGQNGVASAVLLSYAMGLRLWCPESSWAHSRQSYGFLGIFRCWGALDIMETFIDPRTGNTRLKWELSLLARQAAGYAS
jgi:hypothetical protein